VTVSLGLPAKFLFGGSQRADRQLHTILNHGDVCVWGGPSRLAYHGIDPIKEGSLTFREAM
jgi:alkylated DNA repair protein (DNA oxidative demethylase)